MRYLGVIIDESLTNKNHLDSRRNMIYNALNKIGKLGFNILDMKYNIKVILYKTFIRAVLCYGTETHSLNMTELKMT